MDHLGPKEAETAAPTCLPSTTPTATATSDPSVIVEDNTVQPAAGDGGENAATWEEAGRMVCEDLQNQWTRWCEADKPEPGRKLIQCIASCVWWATSEPQRLAERCGWRLSEATERLARELVLFGQSKGGWEDVAGEKGVSPELGRGIKLWLEAYPSLENPPPPVVEKKVGLETLAELLEQKVSHPQICRMFGWMLPDGLPDLLKLRDARAGNVKPPTHKITRSFPEWPQGPSPLKHAMAVREIIATGSDFDPAVKPPEEEFVFADEGEPIPTNSKGNDNADDAT